MVKRRLEAQRHLLSGDVSQKEFVQVHEFFQVMSRYVTTRYVMKVGKIYTESSIRANLLNNLNFYLNIKLRLPTTYVVARICQDVIRAKTCHQVF